MLIFFFIACQKEKKDTSSPSVSISNPVAGQGFNMFDTIQVTAHVHDDRQLTSVVVGLSDANNSVVQYSYPVPAQSNDFGFTIDYYLTDHHLSSGFYYLTISANDGANSTTASVKIYVTASPTVKTGYFIVTATQPKTVQECDLSLATQNSISLNTAFTGMAFGAYYQQLFINGAVNQPFVAYDAVMNGTAWSYPYGGGGLPYFTCVSTDGRKAYVGYYSGDVGSVSYTGGPSTGYSSGSASLYPYYFTVTSKYGVGIFKDKFGGGDQLYSFFRSSGFFQFNTFMPIQVKGVFERTQDELYIVGNNGSGKGVYYLYNVLTNGLQGPFTLPAAKLLSVQQVNSDYFALAMDDGNIYGFRHSNGNTSVLANVKAQQLIFNGAMSELVAASKNTLYSYSLSTNYVLSPLGSALVADSILAFELITNK